MRAMLKKDVAIAMVVAALAVAVAGGVFAGYRYWKSRHATFQPPSRDAGPFAGSWRNVEQGTGITRIEIGRAFTGISVKIWSKCEPKDCDWGNPTSYDNRNAAKGALSVVWDDGNLRRTQQFALLPDGRLRLQTRILDHASKQQTEKLEYFVRAK